MACLGAIAYDPSTAQSKATTAALAMTAFDTTNARLTFTAPANGAVFVRIGCVAHGASTYAQVLLGILDSTTVRMRQTPHGTTVVAGSTRPTYLEASGVVTGLTPGGSQTWDAAYAVQVAVASTGLKYGGPNNATANDAFGALVFEVWECPNLLGAVHYDPAVAVAKATSSRLAMTAFDTTNARLVVTAPSSGKIAWRIKCAEMGATTFPSVLLGILESSTVRARRTVVGGIPGTALATTRVPYEASGVMTGVSGGSHTYDAAYGVEILLASTNIEYGGPNDATGADAWGGLDFELWAAA